MRHPKLSVSIFIILFVTMIIGCVQHPDKTKSSDNMKDSLIKSSYAQVNGINMYYEIQGSGKPLVLIHGGGSTIETTFGRILPILAQKYKVIAVELQAHGHTSDRNAPESFEQDADDVAELLSQLNITRADIFGFSNGGNTTMQLAIRHPERVNKLIIASAFYKKEGLPAAFWEGMAKAKFSDMPQVYKDEYLKITKSPERLMNMFNRDVHRMQTFKDWNDDDLRAVRAPSLIICGDVDVVLPEHAVAMSHLIPDCRLAIIPGAHGAYLGEITTLVNGKWTQDYAVSLIEQFLDTATGK